MPVSQYRNTLRVPSYNTAAVSIDVIFSSGYISCKVTSRYVRSTKLAMWIHYIIGNSMLLFKIVPVQSYLIFGAFVMERMVITTHIGGT